MAAEEILESTIVRLRSSALEVYGVIKDKLKPPAEPVSYTHLRAHKTRHALE